MIKERILKEWANHPYLRFGFHEDLKALCVSGEMFAAYDFETDECGENEEFNEVVFVVPKDWLIRKAKELFNVDDVQYWLENEYVSDESFEIFNTAMKDNRIVMIEFN